MAESASGRFERKTAMTNATPIPFPFDERHADRRGLGDPVEDDPEDDRKRAAAGLNTSRAFPSFAAVAVEKEVADEERDSAGDETEPENKAVRPRERVGREIDRERGDEHPRPEAHDKADGLLGQVEAKRDRSSDEERRAGDERPESGL